MALGPRDYIDPNKFYPNSLRFMENSFLVFLQALFSNFPPGKFHYDDSPEVSEIAIEGQNTDNLTAVDPRPKIVVARGAVQMQKTGINNTVGSRNLSLLNRQLTVIQAGTVGISCYSREDLEADRIAEIVASAIESMTDVIRQLGFLEIRATAIGQRAMIKSDARPDLFVTPVLIRSQVTQNYNRKIVDPVLLRQIIYQYVIQPVNLKIPPTV
jgi:hypothetical protein